MKKTFLLFFLPIILFSGCKKYPDDDDSIHLKTVKGRLTNNKWFCAIYPLSYNGNSPSYPGDFIIFSRNCLFQSNSQYWSIVNGSWELIDKKRKIRITDNTGTKTDYEITKLDKDELQFKNDTIVFKCVDAP